MKFIRQLDRSYKIATSKQITYTNVKFRKSFGAFMEAMEIDKLITEDWSATKTADGLMWDDYRHRGGVLVESADNPSVYKTSLTFSGSTHALQKVKSLMERYASYDGAPEPEDIELTHQYHDELTDELWIKDGDSYKLDPEVRNKLMANAEAFFSFLKMEDMEVEDVVLTGSAANFNWTENSDVDLHIVVDKKAAEKKYGKLVEEYFDTKKRLWNDLHDITIRGFPVEFYVEGSGDEHVSSGIYSVRDDKWVVEPQHKEPSVDDNAVKAKAAEMIREITDVLSANKAEAVEKLMEKIRKMRQAGLSSKGEFSTENLVFKILRNDGWLEKMHEIKTKAFDRDLSIEDEEWSHYC